MERNLRVAAPIAGGAVVISLFVGLFAGVPLGAALLRAILSGVSFGLLSIGVAMVARSQLPGLEGSPETSGSESTGDEEDTAGVEAPRSGSRLNIVVEDDEESGPETAEVADAPESPSAESAESSDNEDEEVEELVEEVEESTANDEEAVMKAAISEEQDGTSVEIDDTMLDEMPDIGSFAGSFASGGDSESDETGDASGGLGDTTASSDGTKQKKGDPRKGFDNKTIAKALQTFMAKDSE